ncbi:MAG: pseudouridine synthase [Anaerolineales bacterium]
MAPDAPKLQKAMAQAGYGSRRACERMIREGKVTVNGKRANLGLRADPSVDAIVVDGEPMRGPDPLVYVVLHKPPRVLTSLASQGGWPTVIDLVDVDTRVYPVGRLDLESEGLILLTNDGELAHVLTHPSFAHEKEYRVLLDQHPSENQLRSWREGVTIVDLGQTAPAKVWIEDRSEPWVGVIMKQGMKRQIRETARTLGLKVERIVRVRMASLELGELESGTWRYLTNHEIEDLRLSVNSPAGARQIHDN